jgi:hypothetical protein
MGWSAAFPQRCKSCIGGVPWRYILSGSILERQCSTLLASARRAAFLRRRPCTVIEDGAAPVHARVWLVTMVIANGRRCATGLSRQMRCPQQVVRGQAKHNMERNPKPAWHAAKHANRTRSLRNKPQAECSGHISPSLHLDKQLGSKGGRRRGTEAVTNLAGRIAGQLRPQFVCRR